ncbi:Nramp family divalent metal transporter [Enterococcus columbae]|uniref:Divalent metal cation transporter MntH n=1 Tax=Enterococcus columbae DSM 7374 = ATCC 51263 TaxID=1121865 RepID=S0KLX0_9ENTE|nr:Nramp family divalent metal transporter [Enterococcus columbae]EOT42005.1 Mn2+/Fe2+ transporter [Enterococcus columbae DSM 7374 = ATCC 51263]EOW80562.1 Mn2+/Fe2+ transporter [Enterococcus columbae DSM 7374 = ATCC 51263]OJG26363.1 Mn2+/Fe2+ transporter [Enterococcus columbae DSM 7374 = ATCC 51263]HJF18868.1 Nramp family divalent metal transporter [Enterococcus columbae]
MKQKRQHSVITPTHTASLEEINGTVAIPKTKSFWRNLLAFSGPGALVAVGYMDPGNWITSIGGGAKYGYLLLSVVFLSSLIAMLLQYMAAKLGIVTQMDLAQATRKFTNKPMGICLWIITELAVMATDIAEVIGSAIALNLLFGIPLVYGVVLTVFDVFLLLLLMKLGFRKIEAIVMTLILVILGVFLYEVFQADPVIRDVFGGFIPQKQILHHGQLTMALGIVGATVMPHNLYLGSSISQTRKYSRKDQEEIAQAVRFATWDSNLQLSMAFLVNCLLLILGSALFFGHQGDLGTFTALYDALQDPNIAGKVASPVLSVLFAVALLASGQNSTITGTLAGQIVMEGFLHIKLPSWVRRLLTRLLSVTPVIICALLFGDNETTLDQLLIYSQVFLSIALPISMIPLVYFTSSEKIMGKRFKNKPIITWLGWISTIVLTILNIQLIISTMQEIF